MTNQPKRKYTKKIKVATPEPPGTPVTPERDVVLPEKAQVPAEPQPVEVKPVVPPDPVAPEVQHNKQFEYNPAMRKPTPYVKGNPMEGGTHVMTIPVFAAAASKGGFVAYDGDGYYADDTHYDADASVWIVSQPEWATKIVWFNK